MLPIITTTDLQRETKTTLASVKDYAVIQSRGRDVGLLLSPALGRLLLQSDALRHLLEEVAAQEKAPAHGKKTPLDMHELDRLIGSVLIELSKR